MVQTFRKALHMSSDPLQPTIDHFLFNYRLTPHTTTGVSPTELMFGRHIGSFLDFLWPGDLISSKVGDKELAQKRGHTKTPKHLNLIPKSVDRRR